MDLPTIISRMSPSPIFRCLVGIFIFVPSNLLKHPVCKRLYANGEDLDQTPHNAASDLGLNCLHLSNKMNACLWVKRELFTNCL